MKQTCGTKLANYPLKGFVQQAYSNECMLQ